MFEIGEFTNHIRDESCVRRGGFPYYEHGVVSRASAFASGSVLPLLYGRYLFLFEISPLHSICRCHVCRGEKGGLAIGPTRRGKGTKILVIAADNSLPLAVSVQSASPHESQLVEEVLAGSFLDELPARLIGDRAYDSDVLDQRLKEEYDIELIAPYRGQRRVRTQDGRKLRRYTLARGAAVCMAARAVKA
ncbi:MAG: transposase [Candidatus Sulfotelmatobacter sp.]